MILKFHIQHYLHKSKKCHTWHSLAASFTYGTLKSGLDLQCVYNTLTFWENSNVTLLRLNQMNWCSKFIPSYKPPNYFIQTLATCPPLLPTVAAQLHTRAVVQHAGMTFGLQITLLIALFIASNLQTQAITSYSPIRTFRFVVNQRTQTVPRR